MHKVVNRGFKSRHKTYISIEAFEKLLKFLKYRGFHTVTFEDLLKVESGQQSLPARPIILTFDDGYKNNLTHALPLLKSYGMRAVLYLLADTDLKFNQWDTIKDSSEPVEELLSKEERRDVVRSGVFEIGSHGLDHSSLREIEDQRAKDHIFRSKKLLEEELKTRIVSFAYPFGHFLPNHRKWVEEAGYAFAVATDTQFTIDQDPYQIFRPNIFPHENMWTLYLKTKPWFLTYKKITRKCLDHRLRIRPFL